MIILRIIAITCIVIFLLTLYLLTVKKPLANKYRYPYKEDDLIKTNQIADGSADFVYHNLSDSKYINEYILGKRGKKKFFKASYIDIFDEIEFYIVCYDGRKKVKRVIKVTDTNKEEVSKSIKIPKETKSVNVTATRVNGNDVYLSPLYRASIVRILWFTLLNIISFITLPIASYYIILEIIGDLIAENYNKAHMITYLIIICGAGFAYGIIILILTLIKNGYFKRKAGVVYNEF